jgi:hypothetical protein
MRRYLPLLGALWVGCFGIASAVAHNDEWTQAADEMPPYPTHVDRRHGHDHVYPDRGAVVRDLPAGAIVVNYAGISYWFARGVWYEPRGPAYMVVAPPIGLIVPALPAFATKVESGGKPYLYANDVFYTSRPDLGGYEVVNDPEDASPGQAAATASTTTPREPAASLTATTAPTSNPTPASNPAPTSDAASASNPPASNPATPSSPPPEPSKPGAASEAAPSPESSPDPSSIPSNPTRAAIRPLDGQTADQQARDRYECYQAASAQSHFDPLSTGEGASSSGAAQGKIAYWRAQTACLQGRGYEVSRQP